MNQSVDQRNASAGGDIVAGSKIVFSSDSETKPPHIVEALIAKLKAEVEADQKINSTVEGLRRFQTQRSHDGIRGLEAKLKHANRANEIADALEKKEIFAKLLEEWSLYASAQEIFVYLLAKAHHNFDRLVIKHIDALDEAAVDEITTAKIIEPLIDECRAEFFHLDHASAMGLIYWLAEQCFIRWHK